MFKTELATEWRIDYLSSWREGLKFLLDLLNSREASLMLRLMLPSRERVSGTVLLVDGNKV